MKKRRNRSREMSGPMEEWIRSQAMDRAWSIKQIYDYVQSLRPSSREDTQGELEKFLEEHKADRLPSYDQIRRIVQEVTIPDTSGLWSASDKSLIPQEAADKVSGEWLTPNAEDLRCILDVLGQITLDTRGKKTTLTKAEADWIVKIAKAVPGAGSRIIWRLAKRYLLAEAKGDSTEALDSYLAFRPWESDNRIANYSYLVKIGWIKELPGRSEIDELPTIYYPFIKEGTYTRRFHRTLDETLDDSPLALRQELRSERRKHDELLESIRDRNYWLYHRLLDLWDDAIDEWDRARLAWDNEVRERYGQRYLEEVDPWDWHEEICAAYDNAKSAAWEKYERVMAFFENNDDTVTNITEETLDRLLNSFGEGK